MSLRTTLIVTMIGMALLAMILLGFVGIWTVDRYVVREAVLLEPERLEQEGGAALAGAMHVYSPTDRVRNQNTSDKRGSGLGLWLARQVAELHGGTVEADAEPEEWARFRIRMPRSGVSGGRV